jgi:hypothetical protein
MKELRDQAFRGNTLLDLTLFAKGITLEPGLETASSGQLETCIAKEGEPMLLNLT